MQITTLIKDTGVSAQEACRLTGVTQSSLTRRLLKAKRMAKEASTEEERLKQPYYAFLKSYQSALQERSKSLRRQRDSGKATENVMNKHPMVYRNLLTLPLGIREKI